MNLVIFRAKPVFHFHRPAPCFSTCCCPQVELSLFANRGHDWTWAVAVWLEFRRIRNGRDATAGAYSEPLVFVYQVYQVFYFDQSLASEEVSVLKNLVAVRMPIRTSCTSIPAMKYSKDVCLTKHHYPKKLSVTSRMYILVRHQP